MDQNATIKWPVGIASVPDMPATTGDLAYAITNNKTIIALTGMTGAVTVDLELSENLGAGAELSILVTQGATGRDVTLGDGFLNTDNDTLTGVLNDVDRIDLEFDGTVFVPKSNWQKLIDADA